MSRSTPILLVLLGVSILANALLLSRTATRPDPVTVAPYHPPGVDERASRAETVELKELLEAERKKSAELRGRIERLETDKKVLVQEFGPGAAKTDRVAVFREKLRKLMKAMKDHDAGGTNPEEGVEIADAMMELFKVAATRSKEPKTYSEYMQAYYDVALAGEGTALTPAQSAAMSKLFEDFGIALSKVPPAPSGNRLLQEIELEAGVMSRMRDLLTAPQREVLARNELSGLASGSMLSTNYISREGAADQIAKAWSQAYQLDAAQLPQARVAAQAYLDALNRADPDGKKSFRFDQAGTPEGYEARLRSVREQLAALNMLSASMTPAQQERLRTQSLREFMIVDKAALTIEAATPPEK